FASEFGVPSGATCGRSSGRDAQRRGAAVPIGAERPCVSHPAVYHRLPTVFGLPFAPDDRRSSGRVAHRHEGREPTGDRPPPPFTPPRPAPPSRIGRTRRDDAPPPGRRRRWPTLGATPRVRRPRSYHERGWAASVIASQDLGHEVLPAPG